MVSKNSCGKSFIGIDKSTPNFSAAALKNIDDIALSYTQPEADNPPFNNDKLSSLIILFLSIICINPKPLHVGQAPNGLLKLNNLGEISSKAKVTAKICEEGFEIENTKTDSYETYYKAKNGNNTTEIVFEWEDVVNIGHIVLKENIRCSQRVESFAVDVFEDEKFKEVYSNTVIGYKRIVNLKLVVQILSF